MKKKIQKVYQDYGFGFPVTLLNVPLIEVRGEWIPEVDQKELQERVVEALVFKPSRLRGNEIRYIRLFALNQLHPKPRKFVIAYEQLTHVASVKSEAIKIDLDKKSA